MKPSKKAEDVTNKIMNRIHEVIVQEIEKNYKGIDEIEKSNFILQTLINTLGNMCYACSEKNFASVQKNTMLVMQFMGNWFDTTLPLLEKELKEKEGLH